MILTTDVVGASEQGRNIPQECIILQRASVTRKIRGLLTWKVVALVMGMSFITVVVAGSILLWRVSGSDYQASSRTFVPNTDAVDPEIPVSNEHGETTDKLRFVEKTEWGGQPRTEALDKLEHPVPYVIISHTGTEFCQTHSECIFRVRFAQTFHIEARGWSDIAYNFLIGGNGYAYVGRGWDSVGAHSYGYNARSIGISFIGTFNAFVPAKNQLLAAQQLIEYGVKAGKIAPDYKLLGHRQISATLSPGDGLFNVIKTWPHWSPIP